MAVAFKSRNKNLKSTQRFNIFFKKNEEKGVETSAFW